MPSPREQPPQNRNRRRQESMPGGLLWVVILLLLVGVMYFTLGFNSGGIIDYSDFMDIAKEKKFARVVIRGNTRMIGELKEKVKDDLPAAIKSKERYNKLETNIPEPERASGNVTKMLTQYGVPYRSED